MDGVAERVEDGSGVVLDLVGHAVDVRYRYRDEIGEATVAVDPDADRVPAQMSPSGAAVPAGPAGHVPFARDPLANGDALHLVANRVDDAEEFVAHRHRCHHLARRPIVPVEDVQVSSADRCPLDGDRHVVGADDRLRAIDELEPRPWTWLHERSHRALRSTPRSSAACTNAPIAVSSCASVSAALICVRMRAWPCGTTG